MNWCWFNQCWVIPVHTSRCKKVVFVRFFQTWRDTWVLFLPDMQRKPHRAEGRSCRCLSRRSSGGISGNTVKSEVLFHWWAWQDIEATIKHHCDVNQWTVDSNVCPFHLSGVARQKPVRFQKLQRHWEHVRHLKRCWLPTKDQGDFKLFSKLQGKTCLFYLQLLYIQGRLLMVLEKSVTESECLLGVPTNKP